MTRARFPLAITLTLERSQKARACLPAAAAACALSRACVRGHARALAAVGTRALMPIVRQALCLLYCKLNRPQANEFESRATKEASSAVEVAVDGARPMKQDGCGRVRV